MRLDQPRRNIRPPQRHLGWGDLAVFDDEDSLAPEFVSLGYQCNVGEASTVNETELVTRGLVEHP